MRLALLQIRQNAKSRADNIQGMIAAIERAGGTAPAPDLLILPGACDTGGEPARSGLTEAALQAVSETIAFKAREWGVYIAAGLHLWLPDAPHPCAVLFDPDGDRIAWSAGPTSIEPRGTPGSTQVWPSAIGALGVISAPPAMPAENQGVVALRGALIAWPHGSPDVARRRRKAKTEVAMPGNASFPRCGAYWGVVSAAVVGPCGETADGPVTYVCGPDGRLLASAEHTDETIVFAEVPLEPASPEEQPQESQG